MIGRLHINVPDWNERTRERVEMAHDASGQGYAAMHALGVWGAAADDPRDRLYAGYRHVQANPDDGAQWLQLAHTHRELGEHEKAEAILLEMIRVGNLGLFRQVFQEDPRVSLALVRASAGRYEEALADMQALETAHAGLPLYHYISASILHGLERHEEAIEQYAVAMQTLEEGREAVEDEVDVDAVMNVFLAERIHAECGEAFDGPRVLVMEALLEVDLSRDAPGAAAADGTNA